ncbi:NAD-P-binding protein, partial [Daedaleopsis nitida]
PVTLSLAIGVLVTLRFWRQKPSRSIKLSHTEERVLILGASGGVVRALALRYASAGARICIVARREEELENVAGECRELSGRHGEEERVLSMKGDFTVVEDMMNLREMVQAEWGGLDTLVVCAGVPTFLPFCELAGLTAHGRSFTPSQADAGAIRRAVNIIDSVTRTNYIGPAIAAATFIPMLVSSRASSVVLMSSLAAVLPAPTISLYNASKAASFALYRSLAIVNPAIAFTLVLPSTIKGDAFFQSAADGGRIRGVDPNSYGLSQDTVAARCLEAVDKGEHVVYLPGTGRVAHAISIFFPSLISRVARKRYGYPVAGHSPS